MSQLRLELAIRGSRQPGQTWAEGIAAALGAALSLADGDRALGRELTAPAASSRRGADPQFAAMVDHLAALWQRGAPPLPDPARAARNHVLRIARQVLLHIERQPEKPMTELAADLTVFTLTPYIGLTEARRRADSQPG
jgi:hypothetical protein